MPALSSNEREQQLALRRMRLVATGLLVAATTVYVTTRNGTGEGWVGYLHAAAGAGVVGALADWFAVTALFRHPLGLRIPHTAIVPTRKDELGRSLERFVAENFLREEIVRDKVLRAAPAARAGAWLSRPEHAQRVTTEMATAARGALAVLRDEDVAHVLEQTLVRRLAAWRWGPPIGRLLGLVVADGSHRRLVDLAVREAHGWLVANRDVVLRTVLEQAPTWTPQWVDERVASRVYSEALRFVEEVRDSPRHRVRLALDSFLLQLAGDLRTDPATMEHAERVKQRLLDHPDVRAGLSSLGATAKRLLLEAVEDPSSELRRRLDAALVAFGERLTSDAELQDKIGQWLGEAAAHVVRTNRDEIATVISETVNRWDGKETAQKIELQVGRDLQFIRINGTVVGALAGLLLHALDLGLPTW